MKVIFAGTPAFAATALRRLVAEGFEVPLVLTQPDRPAGRGMKLHESDVKIFAQAQGLQVAQPRSLRADGRFPADAELARQVIADADADVMVVAAYGLILPQWVLDCMQRPGTGTRRTAGCLNIHASLLPRWRGAAPIHRAIEAGDAQTGVTIMQMDAGLDTGGMLLTRAVTIRHHGANPHTTGSLHDILAEVGADLVVETLRNAERGELVAAPQPVEGISYARKVEKSDAEVDWAGSEELAERRVRAFHPTPGAWSTLGGEVVKIWRTQVGMRDVQHSPPAGTILRVAPDGIDVACGHGVLRLLELQRAGGKRMAVADLLRGFPLSAGMRFGATAKAA